MSLNRVSISGNLTRDPELRRTQSGTAILSFSVAVNDRRKNGQTGEWEDYPSYVECTLFGKRAESLADFMSKGLKVAVGGKLRQDRWTDKQTGQNRSKMQVIVDEVDLMGQRQQGGGRQQGRQQRGGAQYAHAEVYDEPPAGVYDDDIPF